MSDSEDDVSPPAKPVTDLRTMDERILDSLSRRDTLSAQEIASHIERAVNAVRPRLRVLIEQGAIEATAAPQSRHRRYRLL